MAVTNIAASAILNQLFGSVPCVQPSTLYFGFSSTTPNAGGTGVSEPTSGNYARIGVANSSKANWTTATVLSLSNSTAITFAESTGAWLASVPLTYVVVFDALTVGTLWFYDVLSPSITVTGSGTTIFFAVGGVVISMS